MGGPTSPPPWMPLLTVRGEGAGEAATSIDTWIPLSSRVLVRMISSRSSFSRLTTADTSSPMHFPFTGTSSSSSSSLSTSSSLTSSTLSWSLSEDLRLRILATSFSSSWILST